MGEETLAMHAERLARRVLEYVGDDEIDERMDAAGAPLGGRQ